MAELSAINKLRTMNAVSLYIQTCRCVMQARVHDLSSWEDLFQFLPLLRQSLSCCVCTRVLHEPIGPVDNICHHHVCRECRGGKMRLRPSCSWCKEWAAFVENPQLKIIVKCFKKLCDYLAASAFIHHLKNCQKSNAEALLTIIQEGCDMKDEHSASNDQSLPSVFPSHPSNDSSSVYLELATNSPSVQPSTEHNHSTTETTKDTTSQDYSHQKLSTPGPENQCSSGYGLGEADHMHAKFNSSSDVHEVTSNKHEMDNGANSEVVDSMFRPEMNGLAEEHTTNDETSREDNNSSHSHHLSNSVHRHFSSSSEPTSSGHNSPTNNDHSSHHICHTVSTDNEYNNSSGNSSSLTAIYSVSMSSDDAPKLKIRRTDRPGPGVPSPSSAEKHHANHHHHHHHHHHQSHLEVNSKSQERKNKLSRKKSKHKQKGKGCRCGLATANPGKLTCCGQRCPCYSAFHGCLPDCRCRGCKNTRNTDSDLTHIPLAPTVIENNDSESDDGFIIEVDV